VYTVYLQIVYSLDCQIRLLLYARNLTSSPRSFLLAGSRPPPLIESATAGEMRGGGKGNFVRCAKPRNEPIIMVGQVPTLKVTMAQVLFMAVAFGEWHPTFRPRVTNSLKKGPFGWLAGWSDTSPEGICEGAACHAPARQSKTITHSYARED